MKRRIFALAVALATFASNASAATISILYTGVITTITNGAPGLLPGNPFTLSWFFDTALAAPGDYVNTGTSSLLRGSVPAVGSASFFTPGLGNWAVGASHARALRKTWRRPVQHLKARASCFPNGLFLVGSTLSNPAIPGDITDPSCWKGLALEQEHFLVSPQRGARMKPLSELTLL